MSSPFDRSLFIDTQLGPDPGPGPGPGPDPSPGPAESGLCCLLVLLHNTHRDLSVNNDGGEQ